MRFNTDLVLCLQQQLLSKSKPITHSHSQAVKPFAFITASSLFAVNASPPPAGAQFFYGFFIDLLLTSHGIALAYFVMFLFY